MKRDCYQKLLEWKKDPYRKPLILRGARQVGKTYLLRELAKEYTDSVYINFEKMLEVHAFFSRDLSPRHIIDQLQVYLGIIISPGKTLLIFDEIQECPHALNSLKYFQEEANEYHVVAAGSLLGVKLNRTAGFPVGKVDFLDLKPLSFFEFLSAVGEEKLREMFETYHEWQPFNEAIHQKTLNLLKEYLVVGGMPEVVSRFIAENSFENVRKAQQSILDAYALDFAKHATKSDVMKLMTVWEAIPNQLAKENKKFIFSAISKSARAREYESAIQWLVDAGLIYKSYQIETPKIPISGYADKNIFKIYMLDVGLLGYLSGLPVKAITSPHEQLFSEFKGALIENYVAQELCANHFSSLYYWASQSSAEIDFVVADQMTLYPLEVKAGESKQKKSLQSYDKRYQPTALIRTSSMNLRHDGKIYNYPLYFIKRFPDMLHDTIDPSSLPK